MKRIWKKDLCSGILILFLLMISITASEASTYYECKDGNGNTLLTNQSAVVGMKCKPVMASDDKMPDATLPETNEAQTDERNRTQLVAEIETEQLNKEYLQKTEEIKARYKREMVDGYQSCAQNEPGEPLSNCRQEEQERIMTITNRMQAELKKAENQYHEALAKLKRQTSE